MYNTVTFPCPRLPSMITTQPTPPPNPTTDSEETTTTTIQQTQKPADMTSEGTGTELSVPITSETATDLPILGPSESTNIGLIIGIVMVVIVVIVSVVTVMVIIAILFKKRNEKMATVAVPTTTNQAYGLTHHTEIRVETNIYDHPEVGMDLDNTIEAKQNEAYVANTDIIITEKNAAYRPVTAVETIDEYDYI